MPPHNAHTLEPLPDGFARLRAEDIEHLGEAVAAARHRQAAELRAAAEGGLRFVPRMLRGPLRKVLG